MLINSGIILPKSINSAVQNDRFSIDCGVEITRIVIAITTGPEPVSLRYITIKNDELEVILKEIHGIIDIGVLQNIFITGFRKIWAKTVVESVFKVDVIMVEEILAISKGFELVSNHLNMMDIEYKSGDYGSLGDRYKIDEDNPMFKQIRKAMKIDSEDNTETDENQLNAPGIFLLVDSFVRTFYVKKDKTVEPINTVMQGTAILGGLAKCLIDLNNWSDIVKMANNGNRENVDTQVWEVFSDNEKSPYGKLPLNAPIFPFGKSADLNKNKEDFNRDDLMESTCNLVFSSVLSVAIQLCKIYKTRRIYICGPVFNAPTFSKLLHMQSRRLAMEITCKILKCDYILALGILKL